MYGQKHITTYYVVERVMDTASAAGERAIVGKYRNPHLSEFLSGKRSGIDDVIVFGNPITSRALMRKLPFDERLAKNLSLGIKFPKSRTSGQAIGSATRAFRELTQSDVDVLLGAIESIEKRPAAPGKKIFAAEEVAEFLECDIEDILATTPTLLGKGLSLGGRQLHTRAGVIDLLLQDSLSNPVVVEVKLGKAGRKAVKQIRRYMEAIGEETGKRARGILVCRGIMPAFEGGLGKAKGIEVFSYGWNLSISPLAR